MKTGTVKFFNETKGFGFIKDEAGQEIFVHATGLTDKIKENDMVTLYRSLFTHKKSSRENVRIFYLA
ncbi:MAG: cold shock protein [Bacteroidetes bacterium]|nr:cold shock protein [Bacteroidota bacterium]